GGNMIRRFCVVVFLLLVHAAAGSAQFDSGQVSGFVRDPSGSVIPGASVVATNQGNGEQHHVITNETGYYVFPSMPVGAYSIAAELSGFKKFIQTDVNLSSAAKISVDIVLAVGAITEVLEVQASTSQVQTETAQVGRTIEAHQIQ